MEEVEEEEDKVKEEEEKKQQQISVESIFQTIDQGV